MREDKTGGIPQKWDASFLFIIFQKKQLKLTYEEARKELEDILEQLQNKVITIDDLTAKTKRAKELVQFCQEKLRTTQEELDSLLEE